MSVENATKAELSDVTVSCAQHRITFGVVSYDNLRRVQKTHMFASNVVGNEVPAKAAVRYTTPDKKKHEVIVAIPGNIAIGSKDTLMFSIGDDEKVSVRKDK